MNDSKAFRNHPSIILEKIWKVMIFLVVIFIGSMDDLMNAAALIKGGDIWEGIAALGGGFLLIVIIVLWNVIRWYKTTITIKDGTIEIVRKTLNRHVNTIAVQNISNINLEQNIFEMLVGTYKLKLDTSSLSTAERTDVEIILKKKHANDVKNLIMQMMRELDDARADSDNDKDVSLSVQEISEDDYDIAYNTKEIIASCIFRTNILLFVITIGLFISSVIAIISVIPTMHTASDAVSLIAAIFMQLFAGGSFAAVIIKSWLADFAFRAKRRDNKVYVSCGLIKKRKYAVPVDTINAVSIEYTMLGRIFGRASVKVINIGGEGEDVAGMQLLLAATGNELKDKLEILLPEYTFPDKKSIKRQPLKVFWCKLLKQVIWTLCFMLAVLIVCKAFAWVIPGVILRASVWAFILISVTGNVLAYCANGLCVDDKYVVISGGMFAKKIVLIPYEKIQYITEKMGPIEGLMHVRHADISILASMANRKNSVKSFPASEFEKLYEHLEKTY